MSKVNIPYAKYDPIREATWRYDTVKSLLGSSKSVRRASFDGYIYKAFKFFRRYKECDRDDRIGLFVGNEALYYAHSIFDSSDRDTRIFLEARILARQTDEEIALRLNTLPSVIEWYEALFFNVRDRLNSPDWIRKIIDGPEAARSLDDRGFEVAVKQMAYRHGIPPLEELIAGTDLNDVITKNDELDDFWDRTINRTMKRRMAMASKTVEINQYNFTGNWTQLGSDKALSHQMETDGSRKSSMEDVIAGMIETVTFSHGLEASRFIEDQKKLAQNPALEIRADEALNIAAGKQKDFSETKDLSIPKPGANKNDDVH